MPVSRIAFRRRALLIGLGAAGAVVLLSGAYSTAANKQHFAITYAILELGLRYSVARYADDIVVPDLDNVPAPSSLSQSGREWPAAELFYVTQKGVRMCGMPAWEFRISEDGLWSTVAFLKTMPVMTSRRTRDARATHGAISAEQS